MRDMPSLMLRPDKSVKREMKVFIGCFKVSGPWSVVCGPSIAAIVLEILQHLPGVLGGKVRAHPHVHQNGFPLR